MKYQDLRSTMLQQLNTPFASKTVFYVQGAPGAGKSALIRDIAREYAEANGVKDEQIVEFNPSLRDPVDIMGIPFKSADGCHSEWLPPAEFYNLRQGVGKCILIIEELSDATLAMQNPMCRVLLDRYAGNLKLSDELIIMATGNRAEDRSGANRLTTKLGNRLRIMNFEHNLEDWVAWAKSKGLDDVLIHFLQFRPNLLSDFDPKRAVNPTPRSWERVAYTPEFSNDKNGALFMEHIAGDVGEGAAAEYCGFRRIYNTLPNFDALLKKPATYPIPSNMATLYATVLKLTSGITPKTTKKVVEATLTYVGRVPPELQATAIREMLSNPKVATKIISADGFAPLAGSLGLSDN